LVVLVAVLVETASASSATVSELVALPSDAVNIAVDVPTARGVHVTNRVEVVYETSAGKLVVIVSGSLSGSLAVTVKVNVELTVVVALVGPVITGGRLTVDVVAEIAHGETVTPSGITSLIPDSTVCRSAK
jgi:hypothetical protein